MSVYKVIRTILVGPVRLIFGIKSKGCENIPSDRGCIICANHTSLCDVFVLSAASKVPVRYMAKKELFSVPVLKSIVTAMGAFPVDRKGGDVAALRKTVSIIEEGSCVGLFPQGTRHPGENPRDTEVRHGVGLIAYRAKCDVIPVYIKAKKNKVRAFRKSEVCVGEPIPYEELGFENGGKEEYKRAAELIFDRICTIGEGLEAEGKK